LPSQPASQPACLPACLPASQPASQSLSQPASQPASSPHVEKLPHMEYIKSKPTITTKIFVNYPLSFSTFLQTPMIEKSPKPLIGKSPTACIKKNHSTVGSENPFAAPDQKITWGP